MRLAVSVLLLELRQDVLALASNVDGWRGALLHLKYESIRHPCGVNKRRLALKDSI